MPEIIAPLFSTKVLLGRRAFFFDVRKTKENKPYVKITESSVKSGQKQRNHMVVFDSEIEDFKLALAQVFGFVDTVK
ncbi:MAG TPA: DUF3276 family protein [Verrucomicrobiae bacterium]|nr:DUF3276 family protein [Verrucomicrobiae bacterium]